MRPDHRRRTSSGAIVSVAVHAALLTALLLHAPRLNVPVESAGPPEAVIPILILPRTPPPAAAPDARPAPIRLHRRPQRFVEGSSSVKPLIAPTEARTIEERPARAPAPQAPRSPTKEDALAANARNALRSRLGCNDSNLSRAEREACMDRFADSARDAPLLGLGIDRDAAGALARAARRKERDYDYKRSAGGGPGTTGSGYNSGRIAQPGAPSMGMGSSAAGVAGVTGNDDRYQAKIPF